MVSALAVLGFSAAFATSAIVWPRKTFKACLWVFLFVIISVMLWNLFHVPSVPNW